MSRGIQNIFSEAARTYELINHLVTFGLDILFRKKAAQLARMAGGKHWLDVCSGTGEMAQSLRAVSPDRRKIVSSDFSFHMLGRAKEKPKSRAVDFALADSGHLPFADDSFDLITISYATRNLNPSRRKLVTYLEEFFRVLRPGGVFINLETSQPRSSFIKTLYHLYIQYWVRWTGQLISRSTAAYRYLAYTVPRFYNSDEFARVLREAGFKNVQVVTFMFGTFAIHQAEA